MGWPRRRILCVFLLLLCDFIISVDAALFNYGTGTDDQVIEYSKESSALALIQAFPYFTEGQNDVFISPNGAISFGQGLDESTPSIESQGKSAIAVLYAPASDGTIYYRTEREEGEATREAMRKIRRAFQNAQDFRAQYSIIVTWEGLKSGEDETTNTFQAVLVTDGRNSYAFLLYKEIGWTNVDGKFAQAGFYFHDGRNQKMVNAETDEVRELTRISNFDEDGVFLFRISGQHPEDPRESTQNEQDQEEEYEYGNEPEYGSEQNTVDNAPQQNGCPPNPYKDKCPDGCRVLTDDRGCSLCVCPNPPNAEPSKQPSEQETNQVQDQPERPREEVLQRQPDIGEEPPLLAAPQSINTLRQDHTNEGLRCSDVQARGETSCHANAQCVDYQTGHCCQCQEGYYGNGKECLPNKAPQRINGNFEGAINGKTIPRTDLYTFVQVDDGQQHTALARIPRENGWNLLLLDPIGNVMGWLFAKKGTNGAYNGFDLTGGLFNRTVNIHLGDRYAILIKQEFSGRHIQDYINANVFVSGTLPELSEGAEVVYSKFEESYRREGAGFIRSYTEREITVRDTSGEKKYRMTVDQQIHYKECPHREFDKEAVMVLKVDRISAHYTPGEEVVRFASMNAVTGHETPDTPHQRREPDRIPGPAPLSQGVCAEGSHMCVLPNMFCNPVEHSYRCECLPGYAVEVDNSLDLRFKCVDVDECRRGSHSCDQNADCQNTPGSFICQCRLGYSGDGYRCQSTDASSNQQQQLPAGTYPCALHQDCHQWGECFIQHGSSQGYCKCRGWYVGDGKNNCGPPEEQIQPPQPQSHGDCSGYRCDINADCLPSPTDNDPYQKECVCKPGYHGNGQQCEALLRPDDGQARPEGPSISLGTVCRSHEECGENSNCVYSHDAGYYRCECIPPYKGDGITCTAEVTVLPVIVEPAGGGYRLSGCDKVDFCDPNADCVFERNAFGAISYICRCQPGYTGNGLKCLKTTLDSSDYIFKGSFRNRLSSCCGAFHS